MEESRGPICQSCGMPLQKEEDFGTNIKGNKNKEYCHFCFQNGKFVDEGITMEQKIEKIVEIAQTQIGVSAEKARAMANTIIPKLKRWQKE